MDKTTYITVEDCCDILDNQRIPVTKSDREKGIYPYYGANGIQDYVKDYIFDGEFVLVAEDGGNFGSKTKPIAYRVSGKCWVNNHAHVLHAKSGFDVDYICYALMFYDTTKIVNGATRGKLTQGNLKKMRIPHISLESQKQVVSILSNIKNTIYSNQKLSSDLDELIKSRFCQLFGDPNHCDLTHAKKLENCVTIKDDLRKPISSAEREKMQDGELYPYYGATGQVGWINSFLSDFDGLCVAEDCGNYGPGEYSSYIIRGKCWVNNHAHLLLCNKNVNITYLNVYLMFLDITKYINGSTRSKLTQSQLKKLPVLVPGIKEQETFASFVLELDKTKSVVQNRLLLLNELFMRKIYEYFGDIEHA